MIRSKRRLITLLTVILSLFIGTVLYLTYFELVKASDLRNHALNMRNWIDETKFGRGIFLDRNNTEIVSRSKNSDGSYVRTVNYPHMYSQIIGYNSETYAKSGLEKSMNHELLNLSKDNPFSAIRGKILNPGVGNNVRLTIDNDLQYTAYTALEGNRGAAVAFQPQTGQILAMVSLPSYNVNELDTSWNQLIDDPNSPLYNRATQGLYAPGSTMKLISGMTLLEAGIDLNYKDEGTTTINGYQYQNVNKKAYGEISLREALMHSSNVYFADKSKELSTEQLQATVNEFAFNEKIPLEIETNASRAVYKEGMDINVKASDTFGQGEILASPLNMAMAYAAVGNRGNMMRPTLVDAVLSPDGTVIRQQVASVFKQLDSAKSEQLSAYLKDTADANGLNDLLTVQGAGKTGTAQTDSGGNNAWCCAYAPAKNPTIAVAVVIENGGWGYEKALPACASIINQWFHR